METMTAFKPDDELRCRWQVETDAYNQAVLIYAVKPGHDPELIGRSRHAAHIVRLHNASLDALSADGSR
ncbi:MAG: hypothetical protein M3440_03400 [Chloroflexota bacterium]|nr:hypothetical protein [Chloroflexota bacterium]